LCWSSLRACLSLGSRVWSFRSFGAIFVRGRLPLLSLRGGSLSLCAGPLLGWSSLSLFKPLLLTGSRSLTGRAVRSLSLLGWSSLTGRFVESDWAVGSVWALVLTGRALSSSGSSDGFALSDWACGGPSSRTCRVVHRAVIVDDDRVRAGTRTRAHLAATRPERAALPTTQQGKFPFLFLWVYV